MGPRQRPGGDGAAAGRGRRQQERPGPPDAVQEALF
jgi:hypothetical protein